MTTGTATLYGRFDTHFHRGDAASKGSHATANASATCTSTDRPTASASSTDCRTAANAASSSTASTRAPPCDELERQRSETRPDLEDVLAGFELGEAGDAARGVRVGEEVLAQRLARTEPVLREQCAHGPGRQGGHGPLTLPERAACGVAQTQCSVRPQPHAPQPCAAWMRWPTVICCSRVARPAFGANSNPPKARHVGR